MSSRKAAGTLVGAVGVVLLVGAVPAPAAAGRLDNLKQKLSGYLPGREAARRDLGAIKAKQEEARGELTAAQQAFEQAQVRLHQAQDELDKTKRQVAETELELVETKARLEEHQAQMQKRLLAVYRAGEPQYLEVVFCATSFADFVNRAEFVRRIAACDESLLIGLVSEKQAFERQKAKLEALQGQQAAQEAELRQQRDLVAAREAQAERVYGKLRDDRVAAEREFALMHQEYERIARELALLQQRGGGYRGSWQGNLARPVSGGVVTSRFGFRIHPVLRVRKMHYGIDIAGLPVGTAIKAAADGLVIFAGWSDTAGKMVRIDHGSGLVTLYAHLSRLDVTKGQVVRRGQVIGGLGGTGTLSTGAHLHLGVCQSGRWMNPERFVHF